MLVEPVLGTSTKMHLYLWEIASFRLPLYIVKCRCRRGTQTGRAALKPVEE
jgi:hypothetical protein